MTSTNEANTARSMNFTERMRLRANQAVFITGVFVAFAEITLFRKRFGERYFDGWKAPLVVPLLFFFPVFWPEHDPRPVWVFLPIYMIMCLLHRFSIFARRARGEVGVHSYYNGIPRLMKFFKRADEMTIKGKHEPTIMLALGFVTLLFSQPLGVLFVCCAFAMAIEFSLLASLQRRRMLDMADSHIEGQILGESFRGETSTIDVSGDLVQIHGRR